VEKHAILKKQEQEIDTQIHNLKRERKRVRGEMDNLDPKVLAQRKADKEAREADKEARRKVESMSILERKAMRKAILAKGPPMIPEPPHTGPWESYR